uniref:Uncharacterized protein n=1 Tax=Timema cristinae TaxID=61476 RepID=A0A7R9D2H4_TIMCR|nr:unnamed protein product [Timema cristinae]
MADNIVAAGTILPNTAGNSLPGPSQGHNINKRRKWVRPSSPLIEKIQEVVKSQPRFLVMSRIEENENLRRKIRLPKCHFDLAKFPKATTPNSVYERTFYELLSTRFHGFKRIYTDGSKSGASVGCAFAVEGSNFKFGLPEETMGLDPCSEQAVVHQGRCVAVALFYTKVYKRGGHRDENPRRAYISNPRIPVCEFCDAPLSVYHILVECRKYSPIRLALNFKDSLDYGHNIPGEFVVSPSNIEGGGKIFALDCKQGLSDGFYIAQQIINVLLFGLVAWVSWRILHNSSRAKNGSTSKIVLITGSIGYMYVEPNLQPYLKARSLNLGYWYEGRHFQKMENSWLDGFPTEDNTVRTSQFGTKQQTDSTDQDPNLDISVLSSLAQHETRASVNYDTEAGSKT